MIIFDHEQTFFGVIKNLVDFWSENVCLHLNRPKKVIWGNFYTFRALWDSFPYVLGRDSKSGHICHYSYLLGWGTKRPSIRWNLATFCENVCLHLNRPKKVIWGSFCTLWLLETHSYVLGRDTKSGHICHFSYVYWAEVLKSQKKSRNTATFCMFWKFQLFFYTKFIK